MRTGSKTTTDKPGSHRGAHLDGPLEGLRVIDASTILAGPLCCQILGDFGADVIKIEHPVSGDSMRGHGRMKDGHGLWWKEIARNKRTIGLDLSDPRGGAVFADLCSTADVLVESFRPGTLERWGLGPETLRTRYPHLVIVRISGFGQAGPYAARPGFGTLAEAMSGFAFMTGEADGTPMLPAFGLADSICGIAASSAALMALRHRDAHGTGQVADLSLLEPIMTAVGPAPTVYQQLGVVEERHGNRSTNNAPRNVYRTKDGEWVAISTSAQTIAERVLRLVGHPEVIDEAWFQSGRTRADHADLLDSYVGGWVGERTRAEVLEEFERAGAAVGPVYSARDLMEDEHIRETQMLVTVDDPDLGPLTMHNVMWRLSDTPGRVRFTGRPPGADTDAILGDLGYAASSIEELRAGGVIA